MERDRDLVFYIYYTHTHIYPPSVPEKMNK